LCPTSGQKTDIFRRVLEKNQGPSRMKKINRNADMSESVTGKKEKLSSEGSQGDLKKGRSFQVEKKKKPASRKFKELANGCGNTEQGKESDKT